MLEIDPALVDPDNNKSGVGPAFGHVTNPFGVDVDVAWQDPPPPGKAAGPIGRPEPIKRKFLAVCVDPHKKFTRKHADGRCEEYHCVKYDTNGSHWEVWSQAKVIILKHDSRPQAISNANTYVYHP